MPAAPIPTTPRDAAKRTLEPGDVVLFMEPGRPYLSLGRVDRFTPKKLWVQPFTVTHGEVLRFYTQVSLVTSEYRSVPRALLREIFTKQH